MILSFWAVEREITEVVKLPFSSHHVKNMLLTRLMTVNVGLDHLAKVVFVRFLHCKVSHFFNVYFWRRERVRAGEGQRERGKHRIQSRIQALSCQHRARHGAWTHEPWDHDLSPSRTLNLLSHPSVPNSFYLTKIFLLTKKEEQIVKGWLRWIKLIRKQITDVK